MQLHKETKVAKLVFLFALLVTVASIYFRGGLPPVSDITSAVATASAPLQTPTTAAPITLRTSGFTYDVQPLFDYDITGIVVSRYNSGNILDVVHKSDPGNVGDLCLVWGENAKSGLYRKLEFKSGEFTCFAQGSYADWSRFDTAGLSNNHILPATRDISIAVGNIKIGDQVRIHGYLVNYETKNSNGQVVSSRHTSTVRTDTGNGACEVLFATDITVLRRWRPIGTFVTWLFGAIALGCALFLVATPFRRAKEMQAAVRAAEDAWKNRAPDAIPGVVSPRTVDVVRPVPYVAAPTDATPSIQNAPNVPVPPIAPPKPPVPPAPPIA